MEMLMKAAILRALRTVFQTALSMVTTSAMGASLDWKVILTASCLSGAASILTSLTTGLPEAQSTGGSDGSGPGSASE